jgi:hypothetical protein
MCVCFPIVIIVLCSNTEYCMTLLLLSLSIITHSPSLSIRYREIYFDFKRDFAETAGSITRKREQVELFRGAAASKNKADGEAHLYAEQEALSSSLRSAGSVIGQADEVLPMHDIYICICIFARRNINIYINIKKQKNQCSSTRFFLLSLYYFIYFPSQRVTNENNLIIITVYVHILRSEILCGLRGA